MKNKIIRRLYLVGLLAMFALTLFLPLKVLMIHYTFFEDITKLLLTARSQEFDLAESDDELCSLNVIDCNVETRIEAVANEKGFNNSDYLISLAECESKLDPSAVSDGMFNSRGIFQISEYYHPEVTDECAHNVECSTRWTINAINNGNQWWWTCDKYL